MRESQDGLRIVCDDADSIELGQATHGSRGAKCIHDAGGLVIAQTPTSAVFSGMPQSVISAGIADLVLSPAEAALAAVRNFPVLATAPQSMDELSSQLALVDPSSSQVLEFLKQHTRINPTDFLPSVLANGIGIRLVATDNSLEKYAAQFDAHEAEQLHREIATKTTGFADLIAIYERLGGDLIPTLLRGISDEQDFRGWVVGCAGGQEAYSLAMILFEWFEQKGLPHRAKIFASDTGSEDLSRASKAVYQLDSLNGISERHLSKFFIERPDGFHIIPELRKMCVFSQHNCLHEPPFTKLDFVSCGNLMGRWTEAAQLKALGLLHFALRDSGGLLLDPSIDKLEPRQDFRSIDPEIGLYVKCRWTATGRKRRPSMDSSSQSSVTRRRDAGKISQRDLLELYDRILDSAVSAGWLIDEDGKLLHTFGSAGELCIQKGRSIYDIVSMAPQEMRGAIVLILRHIAETRSAIEIKNIQLAKAPEQHIALKGEPLATRSGRHGILISVITPQSQVATRRLTAAYIDFGSTTESSAVDLRRELEITRENLQLTIQDLRLANEELQEINEELTCANEELQSANEELHSVNEELHTVNTEHQRKIDELTSLNDDLDNLLTNSNDHTLFLTRDLQLRLFTPRIVELFNLIPQDIGRHIKTFNHSLRELELVRECERVVKSDSVIYREIECMSGAWFMMRIAPYFARGNADGVVITFVDISLQKNTQTALLSSEQRFALAAQGSSEGIWDWPNVCEEKIWGSPRLYEILGHDPANFELTHSMWIELVHPDDRDQFEQLLDGGGPLKFECRIVRPDNQLRWVRICGASIQNSQGEPVRMAGSLEDVTDRRLAQEEVKQAVRVRDQFLAMLSHELRNPLGAVIGAVQIYDEEPEHRDHSIAVIRRQSQQMSRLLEDLLDVSRVCHGKFEIERKRISFDKVILAAIECMTATIHQRKLTLDYACPDEELYTIGDAARLQQVIVNLLNNAAKFSLPGGIIELELSSTDREIITTVRDYGVGMPDEFKAKVFEMFVQSDTTLDRSNGGMGVGLTLAKTIVEMHNGRLELHSEGLNRGCELTMWLERAAVEIAPCVRIEEKTEASPCLKIVVVEDMEDLREVVGKLLSTRGHKAVLSSDGMEGLKLIEQMKPDVALIDIGLPNLNGFEIARALRAQREFDGVRLVALTGYGQATDRTAVMSSGFDCHIVKPFNPQSLYDAIAAPSHGTISSGHNLKRG